ncbi:MAG: transporter [Flavobacteriia bacterium]|nr:MAG: transporter [Flavobacteriia bacterium]
MNYLKPLVVVLMLWVALPTQAQHLSDDVKMLIDKAQNKNHQLKINALQAQQNNTDSKIAISTFIPKVTVNAGYTRLNDDVVLDDNMTQLLIGTQKLLIKEALGIPFNMALPDNVPVQGIPPLLEKDIFKANVDVDWVLFSGLKVNKTLKAIKHKNLALEHQNDIDKEKLILKVINAYEQLALIKASQKVITSTDNYLQEQARFVSKAVSNGLALPVDEQKVTLALNQLSYKRLELNNQEALILSLLQQLTGAEPQTLIALDPKPEPMAIATDLASQPRHELLALQEARIAKSYQKKAEQTYYIPQLAIKGHYEFIDEDLSLFDPQWYIGAGLKWTLFDRNTGRQKANRLALDMAQYDEKYSEAEELIALSNIKAELSYKTAQRQLEIAEANIALTEDTYNLVNKQYKNDLTTMTEVLEALKDLEQARLDYDKAVYNQRKAGIEWLYAKGLLLNEL